MSNRCDLDITELERYTPSELIEAMLPSLPQFETQEEKHKLSSIYQQVYNCQPLSILDTQIIYQLAIKYLS